MFKIIAEDFMLKSDIYSENDFKGKRNLIVVDEKDNTIVHYIKDGVTVKSVSETAKTYFDWADKSEDVLKGFEEFDKIQNQYFQVMTMLKNANCNMEALEKAITDNYIKLKEEATTPEDVDKALDEVRTTDIESI